MVEPDIQHCEPRPHMGLQNGLIADGNCPKLQLMR